MGFFNRAERVAPPAEPVAGPTLYKGHSPVFGVTDRLVGPVRVIAPDEEFMRVQICLFQAVGVDVLVHHDFDSGYLELRGAAQPGPVAFIDLDGFGGLGRVFDGLRRIRHEMPDVRIVLTSHTATQDDFSLERLAICDATLRAPMSLGAFDLALDAVAANNAEWQRRRAATVAASLGRRAA